MIIGGIRGLIVFLLAALLELDPRPKTPPDLLVGRLAQFFVRRFSIRIVENGIFMQLLDLFLNNGFRAVENWLIYVWGQYAD